MTTVAQNTETQLSRKVSPSPSRTRLPRFWSTWQASL